MSSESTMGFIQRAKQHKVVGVVISVFDWYRKY